MITTFLKSLSFLEGGSMWLSAFFSLPTSGRRKGEILEAWQTRFMLSPKSERVQMYLWLQLQPGSHWSLGQQTCKTVFDFWPSPFWKQQFATLQDYKLRALPPHLENDWMTETQTGAVLSHTYSWVKQKDWCAYKLGWLDVSWLRYVLDPHVFLASAFGTFSLVISSH